MTKEELREKLDSIQNEFNSKSKRVLIEYAKTQNEYNVGDIIEDHHQTGEIEKIIFNVSVINRSCDLSFSCKRLTKSLKEFKTKEKTIIYGSNIKRKINK